ncbi:MULTISPECIES: peptide chain release factor 3 [Aneurinibacillus]|uniref:Peptide chain release factor 3 n=1 Tax=Aneurinibacillus thermoaerophilus TaxID=143495 RepID=A0A1G7YKF0_ANETH|nr:MULTISPECIES: peptide chain release factor 3 [Aneurinibacillus]AMA73840.1 peptide chain release factor 3 [Aneurinibacillus sp. XH2]MED0676675.1 peptide chain release factor 3 [Aneurinibacillus thermoaerophilus]MED0679337.1 peptide chain release factor 3 [Aneurinibacillus thermoaerophilus]MED0738091.1 peptide chain release factor 3 [Aneurinibacillus thermoaerophilus]MED0756512.1 peptide chain release factor 3 [Aneurinibacillus thermoaerophilus]
MATARPRKTFAIISHPDAGKTTLTEKLLYFGGAIHTAGMVKSRKSKLQATSDWMEIEKQRGISVTSSVMQFSYNGYAVNILDTPGHQDFSEDTYRTLTAADSAVMLIDAAKGVEPQTIKLFEVCRMRKIPIFTFINKMDRESKDPLALLEELEEVLGIRSCPMNWPIGSGIDFKGVYDRERQQVELFKHGEKGRHIFPVFQEGKSNEKVKELLGEERYMKLKEDIELLDIAGDPFDREKIDNGLLTPVFFGSALTNFGVESFLEYFLRLAPGPAPRMSDKGLISPEHNKFSGFVFKIQANMNPAHRDRIAFLRIVSGKFIRGMTVQHVRTGKRIKLSQPQQFLAQERNIVEEAYPGDIIGLFDPGTFGIGDTLVEGNQTFSFADIPHFSPEIFAKVRAKDTMKYKQFHKGMQQLTEEGAVQYFTTAAPGAETLILGVVGQLQLEVFEYRMRNEYGVDVELQPLGFTLARWVKGNKKEHELNLIQYGGSLVVRDREGRLVVLLENEFAERWAKEKNPDVEFVSTSYE